VLLAGLVQETAVSIESQYDKEEQALHDAFERGEMDAETLRRELRELQRQYREEARTAAQSAYDDELERWW
jgi:hypothetical protein